MCQLTTDEKIYQEIATLIKKASLCLVGAGAGMSADSGLPVYGDVSNLPYFKKHSLEYRDVSDPNLLVKNPNVFFGWTALNLRKYREHEPHEGYKILLNWKEKYFSSSGGSVVEEMQRRIQEGTLRPLDKIQLPGLPGPFFVFTTNVDGFFLKAGFRPEEVNQTHGTYERFQCSGLRREGSKNPPFKFFDGPCVKRLWAVPPDYSMRVDEEEMSAPPGSPLQIPSTDPEHWTNHPTCPSCGKLARPQVYLFGDHCFVENEAETGLFLNWCQAATEMLQSNQEISIVFLEIGVGLRLPKIRVHFERMVKGLGPQAAARAKIIRINPTPVDTDPEIASSVIHVYGSTVDVLRKIDQALARLG